MTINTEADESRHLPEHLYQVVEADLRQKIISGELPNGAQIPTEGELCDNYNVSRITVRRAVQNLTDEGLLYKLRGRGTFVSSAKVSLVNRYGNRPLRRAGLSELSRSGHFSAKKSLGSALIQADAHVAQMLEIAQGEPVQYIERLAFVNNNPAAIDKVYASPAVLANLIDLLVEPASLFDLIENHYGLQVGLEEMTIDASIAGAREAELLSCAVGSPVFLYGHVTRDNDGRVLHYSETTWRADYSSVSYTITSDGRII